MLQRLSNVWRINAREVIGGERLHHGRNLVAVETEPGHRRSGDGLECGNLGGGCGRRRDPRRPSRASGRRDAGRSPDRRRARRRHGYFGQRLHHLPLGRFRHDQRAHCEDLEQSTPASVSPRHTSTPLAPRTHGTSPRVSLRTIEYSWPGSHDVLAILLEHLAMWPSRHTHAGVCQLPAGPCRPKQIEVMRSWIRECQRTLDLTPAPDPRLVMLVTLPP